MRPGTRSSPIEILLIEDDPAAARLTIDALRDGHVFAHIYLAQDGEQALQYLNQEPPHHRAKRPDLILLDLSLPKVDGRELLGTIKADERLTAIPVIVLTSSCNPDDVNDAYRKHVACYITKPLDSDEYFSAIRCLKELWFNVVTFPDGMVPQNAFPPT